MSLKLLSLTIENIGPFREKQTIRFPDSGLVLIEGASGSGKSSIMECVAWVLGFGDASNKDQLHWGQTQGQATLQLEAFGQPITVSRTASEAQSKLTFSSPNVTAKNSNKDAAEKLWQALKLPMNVLQFMTHQGQHTKGGRSGLDFWMLNDEAKKSFLAEVLGLTHYEQAAQKAKEQAFALKKEADQLQAVCESLQSTIPAIMEKPNPPRAMDEAKYQAARKLLLEKEQERTSRYKAKHIELETAQVELRKQRQQITQNLIDLHKQELALQKKESELKNAHAAKVLQCKSQKQNLQSQASHVASQGKAKKEQHAKLKEQLAKLLASECPTCQQPWHSQSAIDEKQNAIKLLADEVKALGQSYKDLQAQIEAIQEPAPYQTPKEILDEQTSLSNFRKAQHQAEQQIEQQMRLHQLPPLDLSDIHSDLGDLEKGKHAFKALKDKYETELLYYEKWLKLREDHLENLAEKQGVLESTRTQADWWLALADSLGQKGFLGAIFEEIALEIAEEANGYLSRVPNVAHCTVQITNGLENGKNVRKMGLKLMVKGREVLAKSPFLSGGQQRSLFFALDLALRSVLQRRLGVGVGWVFLDEPMDGLGVAEKSAFIDILEELDGLALVIDHSTEIKDSFYRRIVVSNDGECSVLTTEGL